MVYNRMGITITYKCNICDATESRQWYYDRIKKIGFLCVPCYNARRRDQIQQIREKSLNKNNVITAELGPGSGRIAIASLMERILVYLLENEASRNEFHTIASISQALKTNYNSTYKAIRILQMLQTEFFNNYDLKVSKLRSTSKSNREKLSAITVVKKHEEKK